jgi:hypothetical protein
MMMRMMGVHKKQQKTKRTDGTIIHKNQAREKKERWRQGSTGNNYLAWSQLNISHSIWRGFARFPFDSRLTFVGLYSSMSVSLPITSQLVDRNRTNDPTCMLASIVLPTILNLRKFGLVGDPWGKEYIPVL